MSDSERLSRDFSEDDEPLAGLLAAFDAGVQGFTGPGVFACEHVQASGVASIACWKCGPLERQGVA